MILLDTADIHEITAELRGRFPEGFIFGGIRVAKKTEAGDDFFFSQGGSSFSCIGLCRLLEHQIKDDLFMEMGDQIDEG